MLDVVEPAVRRGRVLSLGGPLVLGSGVRSVGGLAAEQVLFAAL